MKKDVSRALEESRKLEREQIPSTEEIVKVYKDGLAQAEKLRKLLKPAWFIRDEKDPSVRREKKKNI